MTSWSSLVIISGGSACNSMVDILQSIVQDVTYVLGVSDDGGSTSEVLRVLGGPGIGDIRSRLVRLINVEEDKEKKSIRELLSYRLPAVGDNVVIRDEWLEIIEGTHRLWRGISSEKRAVIRGFLVHMQSEVFRRAHKKFDFHNGSIGNFFLTGARLFLQSLEGAIVLFTAIAGITEQTRVIPAINTNHSVAIAAELENGNVILGQCEISHPSITTTTTDMNEMPESPVPFSPISHILTGSNLTFDKFDTEHLTRRIHRIYYINEYGQEIYPSPNPKVLTSLKEKLTLIYSIGSLYTSIMPCLILRDVGKAIVDSTSLKRKILILNGYNDRETAGFSAVDFIKAIVHGCNYSLRLSGVHATDYPDYRYVTHLVYLDNSQIPVDTVKIEKLGIECIATRGITNNDGRAVYDEHALGGLLNKLVT
ncbi:5641_t:CDS:2 [Paraglomus occultum]|uniref:5641_t:CDS:1 n=1 Tax=Paraglomus occultum TaxID=144539 RepID=A0A9N8YW37_9GLOM|nr:5641_t:CDS:2 [Paraglomus occultum]